MSSDGGLGGLLGGLFGGKGGFSKVLQDLLGGPQNANPTASGAGASGKVNIPTPDNPAGPMQAPQGGSMQGQPGMQQPGVPQGQPGVPQGQPGVPQGQPGVPQGQPGVQQPGMPQPGMQSQQGMPNQSDMQGQQTGMPQGQGMQGQGIQGQPGMPKPGMTQGQGMQGQPGMRGTPQAGTRPSPSNMPGAAPSGMGAAGAGGAAAGASAGGLGSLLDRLRNAGLGDQVSSWLSDGPNKTLQPDQVTRAIGTQQISDMAAHAGVSPDEITTGLAKALPEVVDKMTPHGEIPPPDQTQQTMNRLFG